MPVWILIPVGPTMLESTQQTLKQERLIQGALEGTYVINTHLINIKEIELEKSAKHYFG